MDGLRLDAVHAIFDDSSEHLLSELARRVRDAWPERHVHLVLENEENDASRLTPLAPDGFTAQWNDDVHHGLHVVLTGEGDGYYADYRADPSLLPRALAEGFAFQGQMMAYRDAPRGTPSAHLPPAAFVAFLQNHDQIGNRAFGERITALAAPEAVRAAAAIYLLAPQVPMLFMGEEWACDQPFPFFCGFTGDLADAVREGRRAEFARFPAFADPETRARIPDPVAETTFFSAKLDWAARETPEKAEWLDWYHRVLLARRMHIWPLSRSLTRAGAWEMHEGGDFTVTWRAEGGGGLSVHANLQPHPVESGRPPVHEKVWQEGQYGGAWSLEWSLLKKV